MEETVQTEMARDYLDTLMAEYVLQSGGAVKTADVAREVGDLIGASARLVRNELSRSARLTLVDRRWDLRLRHEPRRRSVDGTLQYILRQYGKPLTFNQLAQELSLLRGQTRETVAPAVRALVGSRDTFFSTSERVVGLSEWLLDIREDDDEESLQKQNFYGTDLPIEDLLGLLDLDAAALADTDLDAFVALVSSVEEPVASRLAFYALWRSRRRPFDAARLFADALADDRLVLLPGPAWATPAYQQRLASMILDMSAQQDTDQASGEVPDLEEILEAEPAETAAFELGAEDLDELHRVIQEAGQALPLPTMVSDVFELFPGDLAYSAALRAVHQSLHDDDRFVELPDNRWHLRVLLPPTLHRIPVTLQLSPVVVTSLTGEPVDVPLADEGLEGGLEWEVRAPDLEDIGEEHEVADIGAGIQLAHRQRFVTTYRHFVSGTVKVRKIDRGVFPTDPPVRPLRLVDTLTDDGFELWLNNETGLLCGLDEWYKGRLQPTGHVFYLEWDAENDVWRAEVDDEPDAMQLIPQQRLDELLVLRVRLEHAPDVSALEIIRQLMEKHQGGVSFRRLYTECNIVRRVAKRIIASNLSSYPMFSLSDDETLWLYDERKANKPRNAAKKPFAL